MKNLKIYSIVAITAIGLITACNTKQSAVQILKDDMQRKEIITAIIQNPVYHKETMQLMMSGNMMKDPAMMNMMMQHMMDMADKDSTMGKKMIQMMEQKPMMKKMMNDMNKSASVFYTCPMHPEIKSDMPGKCPKCGMDLVKKETMKGMKM